MSGLSDAGGTVVRPGPFRYARADRFGPPEPTDPGRPERVAGASCPQRPSRLEGVMGRPSPPWHQSQDCLHLSVVAPSDPGPHPVIVFLHGGAFVSGSGLAAWYDGELLAAEQGVVVVGVNYRLGPLGWLLLDGVSPANLGLLDQIAALRWVHAAIDRFGGDPDRVTVVGQSAGGASAALMLELPEVRRLVRRVVVQSGVPRHVLADRDQALTAGKRLAEVLDDDPAAVDVERLLDAAAVVTGELAVDVGGLTLPPWGPTVGAPPITPTPTTPADPASLELLLGWNLDDVSAFGVAADEAPLASRRLFGDAWLSGSPHLLDSGLRHATYRLDWRPEGSPFSATHCLELPLLLGTEHAWDDSPLLGTEATARHGAMGHQLRAAWAGFARHGTVDPDATPDVPIEWTGLE